MVYPIDGRAQMGIDYGENTKSKKRPSYSQKSCQVLYGFRKTIEESRQNLARATQRFMTEINGGNMAKEDIHAD